MGVLSKEKELHGILDQPKIIRNFGQHIYMRTITPKKGEPLMTIDPNIPDLNKTEFAQKKAERARAFIAKHGLPKGEERKKGK
jgi:hypothetical protein